MTTKRREDGLQWGFDDEVEPEPTSLCKEIADNSPGEGYSNNINNKDIKDISPPHPPENHTVNTNLKPCLYEHPATRETIRRRLKELWVANVNQLIRNYPAAVILEAISDFERAEDVGPKIRNPTAFFKSLLK